MKTRAAVIAVSAIVLLGAGIMTSATAFSSRSLRHEAPGACQHSVPLTAGASDGLPWQRHRRWLQPLDRNPLPGQSHLVRNDRTGEWFRWERPEDGSGGPRFMVPTRYAEFVNRRWRADPWSYCLVLAPQPPFRFSTGGFATSAQALPASIAPGSTTTISAAVTAHKQATVLVTIEVHDARQSPVARWVFDGEVLSDRQTATYDVQWQAPHDLEPGLYVINVGVFAAGWGSLHHWNEGTGVLLIDRPSALPAR